MNSDEMQAAQTPLADLKQSALNDYEEAATAAHRWNSFIPKAIKAYNPDAVSELARDENYAEALAMSARNSLTGAEFERQAIAARAELQEQTTTIARLEGELAEYREFVGQLSEIEMSLHEKEGYFQGGEFRIFDSDGNAIASGTDPFDAWKKLREGKDGEVYR